MLEDAIAEAMPANIRCRPTAGQRRGRPEMAPLFVTEIQGFSARIAHRVVLPWSKAEFMGVLAPSVGLAVLRDDGAKVRISQYIDPRCRRHMPVRGRDYMLAPSRRESSQSVEKGEIVPRQRSGWQGLSAAGSGWRQARHGNVHMASTGDPVRQRSPPVGDDGASDRLEQNAVLVRYLVKRTDEDAARSIHHVCFEACGNQPHDLFVE